MSLPQTHPSQTIHLFTWKPETTTENSKFKRESSGYHSGKWDTKWKCPVSSFLYIVLLGISGCSHRNKDRQAQLWLGQSDLLQNASKPKPAVKSQRLMGRIITTGTFSSVTLLLLQPGSLTHLMHLLLLACDSIWSSHRPVKGLKSWLWPWGYTMDQSMKRKGMHQLSMKPPIDPCVHSACQSPRFCVTMWFCRSWSWCCASQAASWPFHSCLSLPPVLFLQFQPAVGASGALPTQISAISTWDRHSSKTHPCRSLI